MHSRIFLVSKNENLEPVYDEDICNEISHVDWVSIQDKKDLDTDIGWLLHDYPEFNITDNSFQFSNNDIDKFKYKIRENRKNEIYRILKREPLTNYDFWEISRAADPNHCIMIKFEEEYTKSVGGFVLEHLDTDKFYIIASYDYHF